jgi:hypothetical protein
MGTFCTISVMLPHTPLRWSLEKSASLRRIKKGASFAESAFVKHP